MKPEKLDPEFKMKWLEALRSGKYQQGQRSLCEGGRYCCLGVAYVVAKGINPPDTFSGYIEGRYKIGSTLVIDTDGIDELLIGTGKSEYWGGSVRLQLTRMNDEGKNFLEIADYIEKKL